MHECEVWLLVDEDGNYVACESADDLSERYTDQVGDEPCRCRRAVKITVRVNVPMYVELTGTAPDEGTASLSVS